MVLYYYVIILHYYIILLCYYNIHKDTDCTYCLIAQLHVTLTAKYLGTTFILY